MKKLLITSDSHGSASALCRILAKEQDADGLFFLGDGLGDLEQLRRQYPDLPVYAVAGNCDYGSDAPEEGLLTCEGVRFFYTHGHHYNVKYGLLTITLATAQREADVVLFGHTHLPELDTFNGVTLFNPGSVGRPVNGHATYGVAIVDKGTVKFQHREVPHLWED